MQGEEFWVSPILSWSPRPPRLRQPCEEAAGSMSLGSRKEVKLHSSVGLLTGQVAFKATRTPGSPEEKENGELVLGVVPGPSPSFEFGGITTTRELAHGVGGKPDDGVKKVCEAKAAGSSRRVRRGQGTHGTRWPPGPTLRRGCFAFTPVKERRLTAGTWCARLCPHRSGSQLFQGNQQA